MITHPRVALRRLSAAFLIVLVVAGVSRAQVAQRIDEGIIRFDRDEAARAAALPSFALTKLAQGPEINLAPPGGMLLAALPASAPRPVFDTRADGRQRVRIAIQPGTSLYGTGEIAGPLLRNGRVSECWNTDAYAYTDEFKSLYQSHPWVLAVRADGSAFGVLADTTWRCEIDLTAPDGITFAAEGPAFPVIIIDRESPAEVMKGLGTLIGTMPLPPKWAIGYHQCRYSYNPESRVREIAQEFRARKIPCDVIWFDIDYMRGYRVFTFDSSQFPDPKGLNADLGAMGFHRIWMIDPGFKLEPGWDLFDAGLKGDHYVKTASGELYRGEVWPGQCAFPDYTRAETLQWWAGLYADFMAQGVNGVWNDMNEPAIFNVESKTMPEDNLHRGGALAPDGQTLSAGPHARFHNVYGMLMAQGTFDGIKAANPDKRPFVLTRAGYLGSHRVAATWTGDNSAEWDDLEDSISMALNLSLSGQPFCGPDVGGFNGNGPGDDKAKAQFYARWFGFGALLPFPRGHTGKGNINKEPWAFGPAAEATIRRALERRYRLLPYYYTLFEEASRNGMPVMRPLFFADPRDPALRSERGSFLIGDDLMVICKTSPLGDRVPAMPRRSTAGLWRSVEIIDGAENDPDLPTLKIRPGAIVPVGPVMEWSGQKPLDPLTLIVSLSEEGTARGELYEDAGDGYAHTKGQYLRSRYEAMRHAGNVLVMLSNSEGNMPRPNRTVVVRLIMPGGGEITASGIDGQEIAIPVE
ncbi:MAG: TIM-barrel domain-containing protein [Phycisphaerales bacterium]